MRRPRQDLEMSGVLGLDITLSAPESHHRANALAL